MINDQIDAIKNVKNLYDSRQKVIDLFNGFTKIISGAIYETKQDETKPHETKQDLKCKCFKTYQQLLHKENQAITQKVY